MAMQVEANATALFNIFNANAGPIAETNDTTPPFTYLGDNPTNRLISADQGLRVGVQWTSGGLIPSISNLTYTATLYVDGVAINSQVIAAPLLGAAPSANYSVQLTMPDGQPVGVHELKVTLTVRVTGSFHLPVAGFQDLGNIQVYPA